jgi:2-dehydropantoate 2-reductase
MRIAVIGAGGTGGLYGGVLARAGHEVVFLARGQHLRAIQQHGLEVRSTDFGTFHVQALASDHAADLGQASFALLAVKTYDLDAALEVAQQVLAPDGHVLTVQNGLEAPDQAARVLGAERVLIGTTALETTILEPGVIGHLSPGHLVTVSAFSGPPTPAVDDIATMLKAAGINTLVVPDGRQALWDKACLLIPIATMTSVCRATVGMIREVPETLALADTIIDEVVAVARATGYDLSAARERARTMIRSVPAGWKASMARDFERGGRTELEAITGALVRIAQQYGVEVPASRTAYAILELRAQSERPAVVQVGAGAARE